MFLNTIFMNVLSISLAASFSFILILFAREFLDKKVDLFKKSLLWIIFIIVLLIPINFPSKISIKNLFDNDMEILNFTVNTSSENLKFDNNQIDNISKISSNDDTRNYILLLSLFWEMIAVLLIGKDIYFYIKISKIKSIDMPDFLYSILSKQKEKLNITNDIKIVIQDNIKTPSLYGITNVSILIPKSILQLEIEELEMIIFHELLHYKKKHNLSFIFLKIIEDIHWFNPIIKFANSLIREDLECLVDLNVIKQNYNRITYSKTILKLIDCVEYSRMKTRLIPGIYNNKKSLERRILNMKNNDGNIKHAVIIIAVMITLISILTISFASESIKTTSANFECETVDTSENHDVISIVKPLDEIKITNTFGERMHPLTKEVIFHRGVDLAAEEGIEIYAIMDGVVVFTNYETERGNTIRIKHKNGYASTYAHGLEFLVKPGDEVKAGQPIMKAGATGMATGPHLHLELENAEGELIDINKMFE